MKKIPVNRIMMDLRKLAEKKAGLDFALSDDIFTNQVTIARGLLLLLDDRTLVERQ